MVTAAALSSLADRPANKPDGNLTGIAVDITPTDWIDVQSQASTSIAAVGDRLYLGVCRTVTEPTASEPVDEQTDKPVGEQTDEPVDKQAEALLYEYEWETRQWVRLAEHRFAIAPTDTAEISCHCQLTVISGGDSVWLLAHFLSSGGQRLLVAGDALLTDWAIPAAKNSLIQSGAYYNGSLYVRMVHLETAEVSLARTLVSPLSPARWQPVALPGKSAKVSSMVVWGDREQGQSEGLYGAIANPISGFELWRYAASTDSWQPIHQNGLYRYSLNPRVDGMVSFQGNLYLTTAQMPAPSSPARFELICLYQNGDWDLLAGQPRFTPAGLRAPLLYKGPGFDTASGEPAYLTVHQNRLYLGFPSFEGFQLWCSSDGNYWSPLTVPEFSQYHQLDQFETASTPFGLVMACDAQTMPGSQARRLFLYQDSSP